MSKNLKITRLKLLTVLLLLIIFNCEKDSQSDIEAQKSFLMPSIEAAKSYFNANSKYAVRTSTQAKNGQSTSYTDWGQSKEKTYKQTPQQDFDILYTPRYISTDQEIKSFVASTTYSGVVESKIFFIIYRDLEITNGLSGFVFIYNLDGELYAHYNYQNGQQIAFPNSSTSIQGKSTNCDQLPIGTLEEFEQWAIACHSVHLDEVLIIGGTDNTTTNNSTPIYDGPNWTLGSISYEYPDPNANVSSTGSNSNWWVSSTLTANGYAIMEVIAPYANLSHLNWLDNVATTDLLAAIAAYLNRNRVKNQGGEGNTNLDDNDNTDFNLNQYITYDEDAIEDLLDMINGAVSTGSNSLIECFLEAEGGVLEDCIFNNACGKINEQIIDIEYDAKIEYLKTQFNAPTETGFAKKANGIYVNLNNVTNGGHSLDIDVGGDMLGFAHTHLNDKDVGDVDGDGIDDVEKRIHMFSPNDIRTFLQLLENAHTNDLNISDIFGTMVSSSGTYTLRFNGDINNVLANFTPALSTQLASDAMKTEFLKYIDQYRNNNEKAFLHFFNDVVGIVGVKLFKIQNNGTVKEKSLKPNGNIESETCPDQ